MPPFESSEYSAAAGRTNQDAFGIWRRDDALCLAIADGAGGSTDGSTAAKECISHLGRSFQAGVLHAPATELRVIDQSISSGETTAVILLITGAEVHGASVGDSKAALLRDDEFSELTERQIRKPLLGSREARPVEFRQPYHGELLLIGSDGFWNFCPPDRILPCINFTDFAILAKQLTDLCRLQSQALSDDTTVICARPRKTRRRFR